MRQYSLGLWNGIEEKITDAFGSTKFIERDLPYNPELIKIAGPGVLMWGYWQTEKYFFDIRDELREIFKPKNPLTERGQETLRLIKNAGDRSVFLTIRRSDYVKSNFHGVLDMEYYEKSLSIIASRVQYPVIFVFSDEPEWCKENLKFPYETIISGNFDMTTSTHLGREDEELWLMRNCKHAIMANSSYSWWGAWLNDSGIVIAPERWFISNDKSYKDIIPSRWIKI